MNNSEVLFTQNFKILFNFSKDNSNSAYFSVFHMLKSTVMAIWDSKNNKLIDWKNLMALMIKKIKYRKQKLNNFLSHYFCIDLIVLLLKKIIS